MENIFYSHTVKNDEIYPHFQESPFFSEEAFSRREQGYIKTNLVVAKISDSVVWVLNWTLYASWEEHILLLNQVEVLQSFRNRGIGRAMIQETERYNSWKYILSEGWLTSPFNFASLRMLLASWYTKVTPFKLIKVPQQNRLG